MKKTIALVLFVLSVTAIVSAQNNNVVFSKIWVYPNLPDNLIKKNLMDTAKIAVCGVYPPDSLRTFANIRGMDCDKADNLYVWDDGYLALWKFSPDGKKLWRKKYEKDGKADGTFNNVGPAFAVSRSGQICLGDKGNKTITILDSSGKFLSRFKVTMWPAAIAFGLDGSVYVTGFGFTYKGDLVHHYSQSGELLGTFCKRIENSKAVDLSGNSGKLSVDDQGNVYYLHFFPYRIEKFSKDGQPLKIVEFKKENFTAPAMAVKEGVMTVDCLCGLKGLTYLPQGYFAVVVYDNIKEDKWTIDYLDTDGNLKASVSKSELPLNFMYRSSVSDSKGNVYYDISTKDDPVIIKYSVNYKDFFKN